VTHNAQSLPGDIYHRSKIQKNLLVTIIEKGQPGESRRRKAMGLKRLVAKTARLPNVIVQNCLAKTGSSDSIKE
jgi:hypothetical protein